MGAAGIVNNLVHIKCAETSREFGRHSHGANGEDRAWPAAGFAADTGAACILSRVSFLFEIKSLRLVNPPCAQYYPQNLCRKVHVRAALFFSGLKNNFVINDLCEWPGACAQSCPQNLCTGRNFRTCLSFAHSKIIQ